MGSTLLAALERVEGLRSRAVYLAICLMKTIHAELAAFQGLRRELPSKNDTRKCKVVVIADFGARLRLTAGANKLQPAFTTEAE